MQSQKSLKSAVLGAALVCASLSVANAQAWATGYPKLEFGSHLQSSELAFPATFGAAQAEGGRPQQMIFRFKAAAAAADLAAFAEDDGTTIEITLPGFFGADNEWLTADVTNIKGHSVSSAVANPALDIASLETKWAVNANKAKWSAATGVLTLYLGKFDAATIQTGEFLVVLEAASFKTGKGPIPPECMAQNDPMYVSEFLKNAVTSTATLKGAFGKVAPIGCFGTALPQVGVAANTWLAAKIGQSSSKNGIGMTSSIAVTLRSNLDISSISSGAGSVLTSKIEITGLVGSQTSDSSTLTITTDADTAISVADLFKPSVTGATVDDAEWDQKAGKITLTINTGKTLHANLDYVFTFDLQLSATPMAATAIEITAFTGTTVVIPTTTMASGSGNAAPLMTAARAFISSAIGQKISGPGQDNTIYVTLMSNFNIQSTATTKTKISIAGLTGSQTADSSEQNPIMITSKSRKTTAGIFEDEKAVVDQADWVKVGGLLVFNIVAANPMLAGTEYVLSIPLTNAFTAQASPAVTIKLAGEIEVAATTMTKGAGHAAPFYITEPQMLTAKIGQSTCSIGESNTLTVTLESNVGIQTVGTTTAKVTISGLAGFITADSNLAVTNKGYDSIVGLFESNVAVWKKTDGTLTFTLAAGQSLVAGTMYVFQVTLTNPAEAREALDVTFKLVGANNVKAEKIADKASSSNKQVLKICQAAFDTMRIGQEFSGAAAPNTIHITIKPNIALATGVSTAISIAGLLKSTTSDNTALPITGCGTLATEGKWTKSSGELLITPLNAIAAGTSFTCSFQLNNPSAEQLASTVSISVNSIATGQLTNVIEAAPMRNAPGNKGPFRVIAGTFDTAKISQDSPFPGWNTNTITVTLKANVPLGSTNSVVSSITILGLTGSQTSDSSALALTFSGTAAEKTFLTETIGTTAVWTRLTGQLVIKVINSKQLDANKNYVIHFALQNPDTSQASPMVNIAVSGGTTILAMPMKSRVTGCVFEEGDTAPLFVYPRTFLTKKIGYRTTTPQASNVVTVTLQPSVTLSYTSGSSSKITVSGLTGMATADSSTLAITSTHPTVFGTTAEWTKATGTLIFTIQTDQSVEVNVLKQYVISAPLANDAVPFVHAPIIASSGLGASIANIAMDQTGHYALPPTVGLTGGSGAVTSIEVSFTAVKAIAQGDTIVVSLPGFGGSSTDSDKQIFGVTSSPSIFAIPATEDEYNDLIAGGSDVAQARYRAGDAGTVQAVSSEANGEKGSTIKIKSSNRDVFGANNVYAGQMVHLDGSGVEHHVVRQVAAAAATPAVLHFFPKYGGGTVANVAAGTKYTVVAQLELTSKDAVCAGTRVSITIPVQAGITVPAAGITDKLATVQLIRTGVPLSMQIGTPEAGSTVTTNYAGETGRGVVVELDATATGDYYGYPMYSAQTAVPDFIHIDGYRHITDSDTATKKATMFTGYGPRRDTVLIATGATTSIALAQWTSLANAGVTTATTIWLTLSALPATLKPAVTTGAFPTVGGFVQIQGAAGKEISEVMRFTGNTGNSITAIATPTGTGPGATCQINSVDCDATNNCFTVAFGGANCAAGAFPKVKVTMAGGKVTGFVVQDGGSCTGTNWLTATFTAEDGVNCGTNPTCGAGQCGWTASADQVVYEFSRAQLGTSAAALTCSKGVPCANLLMPTDLHIGDAKLADLLYTKSPAELGYANGQKLKIADADAQLVTTAAAGKYVKVIANPQTVGVCTVIATGVACGVNDPCAKVTTTGCTVNPTIQAIFTAGGIKAGGMKLKADFDGLCSVATDAKVVISVNTAMATCTTAPACGTGCLATLDTAKDVVHVIRTSDYAGYANDAKVLRVHPAQTTAAKFSVVMMPPTGMAVVEMGEVFGTLGVAILNPTVGIIYTFLSADGTVLVHVVVSARRRSTNSGITSFTVSDTGIVYPASCALTGCVLAPGGANATEGAFVASPAFDLAVERVAGSNSTLTLTAPLKFNKDGAVPVVARRNAPAGYEYRLNGNCACPASISDEVTCAVLSGGTYQAVLQEEKVCAPKVEATPVPGMTGGEIAGIVCGVVGFIVLVGAILFCCRKKKAPEPEVTREAPTKDIEEGPVYVGRPVPLTPQMIANGQSPLMMPMDSSGLFPGALAMSGSPMMATQLMEPLPTTYMPASYPAQMMPYPMMDAPHSPGFNTSNQPLLQQQGTPMQYYVPSSPQAGMQGGMPQSPGDASRVPYGV